jgi:predicted amidohydrolase
VRTAGISPDTSVTAELTDALGTFSGATAREVAGRDPEQVRQVFRPVNDNVLARTREAAEAGARIVFWSEQSANVLAADEQPFLDQVSDTAREHRIYLQAAVALYLPEAPYAANRTYMFGPDGRRIWTYDKAHPIPGLEFYPPGDGIVPVTQTPYGRLASVICFDTDFPGLLRVDADIMIVPARDWAEIGAVHSRMANMRAVENGYSMIRQAEFGVSGAFDPQGRTLSTHVYQRSDRHVVLSDVPVLGSATPYRMIGDVFAGGSAGPAREGSPERAGFGEAEPGGDLLDGVPSTPQVRDGEIAQHLLAKPGERGALPVQQAAQVLGADRQAGSDLVRLPHASVAAVLEDPAHTVGDRGAVVAVADQVVRPPAQVGEQIGFFPYQRARQVADVEADRRGRATERRHAPENRLVRGAVGRLRKGHVHSGQCDSLPGKPCREPVCERQQELGGERRHDVVELDPAGPGVHCHADTGKAGGDGQEVDQACQRGAEVRSVDHPQRDHAERPPGDRPRPQVKQFVVGEPPQRPRQRDSLLAVQVGHGRGRQPHLVHGMPDIESSRPRGLDGRPDETDGDTVVRHTTSPARRARTHSMTAGPAADQGPRQRNTPGTPGRR